MSQPGCRCSRRVDPGFRVACEPLCVRLGRIPLTPSGRPGPAYLYRRTLLRRPRGASVSCTCVGHTGVYTRARRQRWHWRDSVSRGRRRRACRDGRGAAGLGAPRDAAPGRHGVRGMGPRRRGQLRRVGRARWCHEAQAVVCRQHRRRMPLPLGRLARPFARPRGCAGGGPGIFGGYSAACVIQPYRIALPVRARTITVQRRAPCGCGRFLS